MGRALKSRLEKHVVAAVFPVPWILSQTKPLPSPNCAIVAALNVDMTVCGPSYQRDGMVWEVVEV